MLGKKYIQIDGVRVPNPTSFSGGPSVVEKTQDSEAGTDIVQIIRFNKRKYEATFNCSSAWCSFFEAKNNQASALIKIGSNDEFTARIRGFKATLAPNSEMIAKTDGYWTVKITISEI